MLKVLIDGTAGPYITTGEFVAEDERYLVLNDNGVKVNIPTGKILKIEDLSASWNAGPPPPQEELMPRPEMGRTFEAPPATPLPPMGGQQSGQGYWDPLTEAAASRTKLPPPVDKEEVLRKLGLNSGVADARPNISSKELIDVNVVISGAESRGITLRMPENVLAPGRYNPSVAKHVSLNPEIKAILESGIVFDGMPEVVGKNIYIKTKSLKDSVGGLNKSMGIASKVSGAMGMFSKPTGEFANDFSADFNSSSFAIEQSPFDGQNLLNTDEEIEVLDEGTEQEEGSDQGESKEEVHELPE